MSWCSFRCRMGQNIFTCSLQSGTQFSLLLFSGTVATCSEKSLQNFKMFIGEVENPNQKSMDMGEEAECFDLSVYLLSRTFMHVLKVSSVFV